MACCNSLLYWSRSMTISFCNSNKPSERAIKIDNPALMGFKLSLASSPASLGEIESPGLATIVSLETKMFPDSILVGTPASLNSERTGPGGIPVFPEGIIMFSVAMSPALAGRLTLLFSSTRKSLNGYIGKDQRILAIKSRDKFTCSLNSELLQSFHGDFVLCDKYDEFLPEILAKRHELACSHFVKLCHYYCVVP